MIYLFYQVNREQINRIKFVLESFENLMVISTIDQEASKIQITIAPDFLEDCKKIIESVGKDFLMIPLDEPSNVSQGNY